MSQATNQKPAATGVDAPLERIPETVLIERIAALRAAYEASNERMRALFKRPGVSNPKTARERLATLCEERAHLELRAGAAELHTFDERHAEEFTPRFARRSPSPTIRRWRTRAKKPSASWCWTSSASGSASKPNWPRCFPPTWRPKWPRWRNSSATFTRMRRAYSASRSGCRSSVSRRKRARRGARPGRSAAATERALSAARHARRVAERACRAADELVL